MRNLKKYLGIIMMTTILASSFTIASAQKGRQCQQDGRRAHQECTLNNQKGCEMLDLTDNQKAKFEKIKLEGDKKVIPLKNELNELSARKTTLMSASKIDKKAVNKVIKEMSAKREQIQLIRTEQHISMRNELTENQKVMWDKMKQNRKHKASRKNKRHRKPLSNCCR